MDLSEHYARDIRRLSYPVRQLVYYSSYKQCGPIFQSFKRFKNLNSQNNEIFVVLKGLVKEDKRNWVLKEGLSSFS